MSDMSTKTGVPSRGINSQNTFIKGYLAIVKWINFCLRGFTGVLLIVMSLIVFSAVVSRYTANFSIAWVEEIAVFMIAWIVAFGTALAIRARHMIAVEAVAMLLSGNVRKILKTFVGLVTVVFLLVVIVAGWKMAVVASIQQSPTLPWLSMFWVYIAMPVGGCFMILNMLANMIELWIGQEEEVSE